MNATFCPTKAGNGFKIIVDDEWLYTSKKFLKKVINGKAKSCQFRSIQEEEEE